MMIRAFLFLLLFTPSIVFAQFEACRDMFPSEPPAIAGRDICFSGFAVLHSAVTKNPIYVVERLDRNRLILASRQKRTGRFYEEARLPSVQRARLSDYAGSGYDRGHMAPAGDMADEESMAQSFSLANVVPQVPEHNRKTWADIEKNVRKFVKRQSGPVYVFTGVAYDSFHRTIGNGVWVPSVLWKVIKSGEKVIVYWSKNAAGPVEKPISYQEFVRRTGLRLF